MTTSIHSSLIFICPDKHLCGKFMKFQKMWQIYKTILVCFVITVQTQSSQIVMREKQQKWQIFLLEKLKSGNNLHFCLTNYSITSQGFSFSSPPGTGCLSYLYFSLCSYQSSHLSSVAAQIGVERLSGLESDDQLHIFPPEALLSVSVTLFTRDQMNNQSIKNQFLIPQ